MNKKLKSIERILDEADYQAENTSIRYTKDELFKRVKQRIKQKQPSCK